MSFERTPTLQQVINKATDSLSARLRVAIPARVEAYYPATQTADCHPLVKFSSKNEDGTSTPISWPVIPSVPVLFPGGGGFRTTFPLKQGDTVELVFQDLSIDKWLNQGGEVDPIDLRQHHLSDAIAIPILNPRTTPWTGASANNATMGKDGGPAQIVFLPAVIHLGTVDGNPATEPLMQGNAFQSALNTFFPRSARF